MGFPVFLPMVLQVPQDYASFSALQNYASHILGTKIHSTILIFSSKITIPVQK